jgi:hypothetical protein
MVRTKNNMTAGESVSTDQAALRDNVLTDGHSDKAEYDRLNLLHLKYRMGIITKKQIEDQIIVDDPVEVLSSKINAKLNKMSVYDPTLMHIFSTFGSRSRVAIAKQMAQKYVSAQALKHTVRKIIPDGITLDQVGQEELFADLGKQAAAAANPMQRSIDTAYERSSRVRDSQLASDLADRRLNRY